jgi:O-antigen ligase
MLKWINKPKPILEKFNFFIGLVLVFMMPFHSDYVRIPVFLNLWALSWLIEGNFKAKYSQNINKHNKKILLLGTGFYLMHVISLIYTKNLYEGIRDLEIKLSLFAAPFLLITANYLYKKYFNSILLSFVAGNLLASIICLINAFINSWGYKEGKLIFDTVPAFGFGNFFTYGDLSFFLHPTYFSIYITFAISILFYLFRKPTFFPPLRHKILFSILIVFFTIFIILLMSRAGILIGFLLCMIWILYYFGNRKKILIGLLLIFIMILGNIYLVFNTERMTNISNSIKNEQSLTLKERILKLDNRVRVWYISILSIKENMLLGTGLGDIKDELIIGYKKHDFENEVNMNLDAHNQYFESYIGMGFIGIALLISMIYISIKQSVLHKNKLSFFLFLLIALHFLFESVLNNIVGVTFFAFFFYFLNYCKKSSSNNEDVAYS